jgi:glycosyltransferase involved in cell wall biosynthesis
MKPYKPLPNGFSGINKIEAKPKDRRLRWIWNSNAIFVPSGYGVESRDILVRLQKDGWPMAHIAFTGLEGGLINLNGIPIYPKMGDAWGADAMIYHSRHFQAQAVFTMQDVWTLNPQALQQIPHWIPYVPIDQEPVPENVLNALKFAYRIITFSKWGQKALSKAGFVSTYIPEGTDTNIMKPQDKAECRKMLNVPEGKFVVGMVGANKENPPRKGWQQALEAFAKFHEKHPDSIFFFETNQQAPGGFPIRQYAQKLGISDTLFAIDEYMSVFHAGSEIMSKMYNAFDVLLHPSLSEGFGLCAVEAQACGTPVIVNDACSMPELVIPGVTGEICEHGDQFFTNALGYFVWPKVDSIVEKLEKIYNGDRVAMGKAAREHVLKNYDIDTIVKEHWIPYLEQLQEDLLPKGQMIQPQAIPQMAQITSVPELGSPEIKVVAS